jgi:hypothetical protein
MNIRSKPKNADAGNEYASLQDYLIWPCVLTLVIVSVLEMW